MSKRDLCLLFQQNNKPNRNNPCMLKCFSGDGFTIVELLVVIVVIGILAAITIVAYSGISNRAVVSSLQSDLTNAANQFKLFQVDNSNYPTTIDCTVPDSTTNKCVKASNSNTFTYQPNNSSNPQTFCITATKSGYSYSVNNNGSVIPAAYCPVLYLDAGNILSYPGAGTVWTDLSGNGNSGTLYGGVTYSSANGGVLGFDGTGYVISNLTLGSSCTLEIIIKSNGYAETVPLSIDGDSYGSGPNFYFTAGVITWNTGDGAGTPFPGSSTLNSNYHHVVISNNYGTNATLYVDGARIGTAAYKDTTSTGLGKFFVGEWHGGSNRVTATIPVVKVYNKALSADEASQSFINIRSRFGI